MIKMLILFFGLNMVQFPEQDIQTAIEYHNELGVTCVPKTLKDNCYIYKTDSCTYDIKEDLNNIPWVVNKKRTND